MRSSRSRPEKRIADPLDPGRNGFTHRGLHRGPAIPDNSLVAFAAALELGAGIECDLRLTADNQVVVFHDRDALRVCGDPAVIGQSTLAELARLNIPSLASLLTLVEGRVPLLLEVKIDNDLWRFGPALRHSLRGYGGRFGVMSFDPRLVRWLKTNAPEMRRGLVVRDSLPSLNRWGYMKLADPQFLAVDRLAAGKQWVVRARTRMPVYSWTIATPEQRRATLPHVDHLIWEADGRP